MVRPRTDLVRTEDTSPADGLLVGDTVLITLEELEHVIHGDMLNVDLVLVVDV